MYIYVANISMVKFQFSLNEAQTDSYSSKLDTKLQKKSAQKTLMPLEHWICLVRDRISIVRIPFHLKWSST